VPRSAEEAAPGAARRLDKLDRRKWPEGQVVGVFEHSRLPRERFVIAQSVAQTRRQPIATLTPVPSPLDGTPSRRADQFPHELVPRNAA
jgi:hypothetical protein